MRREAALPSGGGQGRGGGAILVLASKIAKRLAAVPFVMDQTGRETHELPALSFRPIRDPWVERFSNSARFFKIIIQKSVIV